MGLAIDAKELANSAFYIIIESIAFKQYASCKSLLASIILVQSRDRFAQIAEKQFTPELGVFNLEVARPIFFAPFLS